MLILQMRKLRHRDEVNCPSHYLVMELESSGSRPQLMTSEGSWKLCPSRALAAIKVYDTLVSAPSASST